jgi:ATP-dependent DNA helicase RecG
LTRWGCFPRNGRRFCFLVPDKTISADGLKRLNIIEKSNDGFLIAEADLKNRGEGDLFGTNQSGNINSKHIASIFEHFHIFEKVKEDIEQIKKQNPQLLKPLIDKLLDDKKISSTI